MVWMNYCTGCLLNDLCCHTSPCWMGEKSGLIWFLWMQHHNLGWGSESPAASAISLAAVAGQTALCQKQSRIWVPSAGNTDTLLFPTPVASLLRILFRAQRLLFTPLCEWASGQGKGDWGKSCSILSTKQGNWVWNLSFGVTSKLSHKLCKLLAPPHSTAKGIKLGKGGTLFTA